VTAPNHLDPAPASVARAGSRRPGPVGLLVAAVLLTALVQALVLQTVVVTSDELAPTAEPGDRVLVWKALPDPGRGDVVVVDTTDTAPVDRSTPVDDGLLGRALGSVARVVGIDIGMQHRLAVVGSTGGDQVGLTAPSQGTVSRGDVVGTAVLRVWPLDRVGTLRRDAR
jgi:signal peptidase I